MRCMATKKNPAFAGKCDVCSESFATADEVYMDKQGEKWIICKNKDCYDKQGGGEIKAKGEWKGKGGGYYKIPIGDAPKFLNTALTLGDTVLKRIDGTIESKDQIILIESLFKTLSQSYKGE